METNIIYNPAAAVNTIVGRTSSTNLEGKNSGIKSESRAAENNDSRDKAENQKPSSTDNKTYTISNLSRQRAALGDTRLSVETQKAVAAGKIAPTIIEPKEELPKADISQEIKQLAATGSIENSVTVKSEITTEVPVAIGSVVNIIV